MQALRVAGQDAPAGVQGGDGDGDQAPADQSIALGKRSGSDGGGGRGRLTLPRGTQALPRKRKQPVTPVVEAELTRAEYNIMWCETGFADPGG